MKIAMGYDSHRLEKSDEEMVFGGVKLKNGYKPIAHSDGDVLSHALIDAIAPLFLKESIGELFRDDDPKNKGANSRENLKNVYAMAGTPAIINIDITVQSDEIIIAPIKDKIISNISKTLNLPEDSISIKGKTTEGIITTPQVQVWAIVLFT